MTVLVSDVDDFYDHFMHIQIVIFDRVFDAYKGTTKAGDFTEFGFELDGEVNSTGYVHCHANLIAGNKLALAMPKPNAWGSIYGVADCVTGKIYAHTEALTGIIVIALFGFAGLLALVPLLLLNWPDFTLLGRFGAIAIVMFIGLLTYVPVRKLQRLRLAADSLTLYIADGRTAQE